MRFTELTALLRRPGLEDDGLQGPRRPQREDVRAVQHSLTAWLADEEFYLDCIELELAAVARKTAANPAPALLRLADRGMSLRMFYWWPGKVAPPHEHTAWTVTAVLFNTLEVTTYDWDIAHRERRLARKNQFQATRGCAGHVYERCIHSPANPGREISTSLHIFNASDEPRIEQEVGPIAGMGRPNQGPQRGAWTAELLDAMTQRQLGVLAQMVAPCRSERALGLLQEIAGCGDGQIRAVIEFMRWSRRRAGVASRATAPAVQRGPTE